MDDDRRFDPTQHVLHTASFVVYSIVSGHYPLHHLSSPSHLHITSSDHLLSGLAWPSSALNGRSRTTEPHTRLSCGISESQPATWQAYLSPIKEALNQLSSPDTRRMGGWIGIPWQEGRGTTNLPYTICRRIKEIIRYVSRSVTSLAHGENRAQGQSMPTREKRPAKTSVGAFKTVAPSSVNVPGVGILYPQSPAATCSPRRPKQIRSTLWPGER